MAEFGESAGKLGSPGDPDAVLASKLRSLRNLEIAIGDMIAAENEAAARQLDRIARQHALLALEAALVCAARPPSARRSFSAEDIRHAEARLGIEPDTFISFFAVTFGPGDPARSKALGELLAEVRDEIAASPADKPLRETPSWLPAVIRITSAVLVGAAVGAPLAALAVGESVVTEVAKAGISVTACAVAAEVTNRLVERWLRPALPVEPPVPLLLPEEPAVQRGALHPFPEEPAAAKPLKELSAPEEIRRLRHAVLESFEPHSSPPAKPPVDDATDLELATRDVIEPPAPPPLPPPPRRPAHLDDPFSGFGI